MSAPPSKHDHDRSEIWEKPEAVAAVEEAMGFLASNLRTIRLRRKLSQEQLAERAGLHAKHVQRLEKNSRNTTVATVAALATALDIQIGVLFRKPRK